MLKVYILPLLQDNYAFIAEDTDTKCALLIDPTVGPPVLEFIKKQNLQVVKILNTHHHWDHVGGNKLILDHFPNTEVWCSEYDFKKDRIPGATHGVGTGDLFEFAGCRWSSLFVPGHTLGHMAFLTTKISGHGEAASLSGNMEKGLPEVHAFVGDTLFGGGCGRLLEGTAEQMFHSLEQLLNLPDHTRVWCAHEYTLKNLEFSTQILPYDKALKQRLDRVKELRSKGDFTVPLNMGEEKKTNLFLHCKEKALQSTLNTSSALETFIALRKARDKF